METIKTIAYVIIAFGTIATVGLTGVLWYLHHKFPDVPMQRASVKMKVGTWIGSIPVWWLAYSVSPVLVLVSVGVSVIGQVYSDYVVSKHQLE